MFSTGHFIWMGISATMVAAGLALVYKKRPELDRMLRICLVIALGSEVVKILYEIQFVPVVVPSVSAAGLIYKATGAFAPYLELEHLPLELCSIQILLLLFAKLMKDGVWRRLWSHCVTCPCITEKKGNHKPSADPGFSGSALFFYSNSLATCFRSFRIFRCWGQASSHRPHLMQSDARGTVAVMFR